ncbi:uncharacterized protein F4822DRAFT_9558 [Hypoxylon trugodes]|uniref:uncharacterized protein n=1 Tax=Hypoxylon trugodes TaxID=326681 RepID=UPI0021A18EB0|nr:uncharacterized protein F4822DRAFT_9558 [Hypoxylon trugodes]KAI1393364.1 hypothetical protein F4822DRAFT_9558 [Hypoxylon trugodes]
MIIRGGRSQSDGSDADSSAPNANGGRTVKLHRRSHRKSRRGCSNCKKARKKCDEVQPTCSNCVRRQLDCDLVHSPTPDAGNSADQFHRSPGVRSGSLRSELMTPGSQASPQSQASACQIPSAILSYEDMEFLHHFSTDSDIGVGDSSEGKRLWQIHMPKIGFAHPFALHLILAFSALHLAQQHPNRRDHLIAEAGRHHTIGLSGTTDALRNLHSGNSSAVYISAMFASFCDLAFGPQTGEYLAFNDRGTEAKWFTFLKGVRSIMESGIPYSFPSATDEGTTANDSSPEFKLRYHPAYTEPFRTLRNYILYTTTANYTAVSTYMDAFELLKDTFDSVYAGLRNPQCENAHFSVLIFRWLYLISDDLAARLQKKERVALIIFAHFAVLFREMESFWFTQGWPTHILHGVYNHLEESDRVHIQWPVDELSLGTSVGIAHEAPNSTPDNYTQQNAGSEFLSSCPVGNGG